MDRNKRLIEIHRTKIADMKIVGGLKEKGYSNAEIAEMMDETEIFVEIRIPLRFRENIF